MYNPFRKIDQIHELIESGADPDVVEEFVVEVEEGFVNAAMAHVQTGEYEQAIREYFNALLLPRRTPVRDRLFRQSLRASEHLQLNGDGLKNVKSLSDPRYDSLKAELIERLQDQEAKSLADRFAKLDSEPSLRAKNFDELKKILAEISDSKPSDYLIAELRLSREEKAQQLFNQIVERFAGVANEADSAARQEQIDGVIRDISKQAVDYGASESPIYADQIREYVRRAEDLLIRSHAETKIDEICRDGAKLRHEEFTEFTQALTPDSDGEQVLRAIVRAVSILEDENLLAEIRRIAVQWTKSEARLLFRRLVVHKRQVALEPIQRSLRIIEANKEVLPPEISGEFYDFLAALEKELIPPMRPVVVEQPIPALEKRGCLPALFGRLRKSAKEPILTVVFGSVFFLLSANDVPAQSDVILAVDLSRTMVNNDSRGFRYSGADQFLSLFSMYGQDRNKAGVVAFGNDARTVMEFGIVSRDKAGRYQSRLAELEIEDWTELGKGLQLSMNMLGGEYGRNKSIVLLSDGYIEGNPNTRGMDQEQARAVAERELWENIVPNLKQRKIKVYTIGLFGADTRGEVLMRKLATETAGFYTHVTRPEEFAQVYKKMLDEMEHPSGITPLRGESNRFAITPLDYGVVITGPGKFSVTSPSGRVYPSSNGNPDTVVNQQYVPYSDGNAILFLGEPKDAAQRLSNEWTGEWIVEMPGDGQATYLSSVRFSRKNDLPERREFFKNEYMKIGYALNVRADIEPNTRSFLEKCRTKYTAVRTDSNTGWSRSGDLQSKNFEFFGEQMLDQAGAFLLEIQMSCGNISYRKLHERFNVHDTELFHLQVLSGDSRKLVEGQALEEGTPVLFEGVLNMPDVAKNFPEYRGLEPSVLKIKLQYDSGDPQEWPLKPLANGRLLSEEKQLEQTGQLVLEGDLFGDLIVKNPDRDDLQRYPVRVKSTKALRVTRPITDWFGVIFYWLGAIGTVMTLFVFIRHRQWRSMHNMSIVGNKGLNMDFVETNVPLLERVKRTISKEGPHISIGGPGSDADVTLPSGGNSIIAEIGKDLFNKFYIVQRGDKQVYVGSKSKPLHPGVRERVNPNDKIIIEGIGERVLEGTFKPTYGDLGE